MDPLKTNTNHKPVNLSGGRDKNSSKPDSPRGRSQIVLPKHELFTARYGEVVPFHTFRGEASDRLPFSSNHEIRSFTMASPFLAELKMFKSYFSVPYQCIMPRTWDLIYDNPVQGDDVPANALCGVSLEALGNFYITIAELWNDRASSIDQLTFFQDILVLKSLLQLENVFSPGGLLQLQGCNLWSDCKCMDDESNIIDLDTFLNSVYEEYYLHFLSDAESVHQSAVTPEHDYLFKVNIHAAGSILSEKLFFTYKTSRSDFRGMLALLRENPDIQVNPVSDTGVYTFWTSDYSFVNPDRTAFLPGETFLNLTAPVAYQLACAEYMTNEYIDHIYSANLYRENFGSVYRSLVDDIPSFSYNGSFIQYDYFSSLCISNLFITLNNNLSISTLSSEQFLRFIPLIFGIRRSLKKSDYFTNSKSRPLALGDVSAPVVGNGVSAVDMSRAILRQRFFNAVNRSGSKFSEYIKALFGSEVPGDLHDPHFICSTPFTIRGFEVENTSDTNTGKQVSLLKSSGGKYEFEVENSIPTIIIGVIHFEATRSYSEATETFFIHKDRYDMFNPFMQFFGDQNVKTALLSPRLGSGVFGYQQRYAEYKQCYDHCSGAFASNDLPSWGFIDSASAVSDTDHVDSDYIRSLSSEFDQFFSSLSGLSLCKYFHFILSVQNVTDANRPMLYNPSTL